MRRVGVFILSLTLLSVVSGMGGSGQGVLCKPGEGYDISVRQNGVCETYINTENECKAQGKLQSSGYNFVSPSIHYPPGCFYSIFTKKYHMQKPYTDKKK